MGPSDRRTIEAEAGNGGDPNGGDARPGFAHSLVLKNDGTVWSFGSNQYGAAGGVGTFATPTQIAGLTNVAAVAADTYFSLALKTDGTSRFVPVTPTRILDTRAASAKNYSGTKPAAGAQVKVPVIGNAGVPVGATAAVLNITVTEATGLGYVQAFPTGQSVPGTSSNLNANAVDQTIPNDAIVPIGLDGTITLYTQSGGHLLADISGYFVPQTGAVAAGRLKPRT